TLSIKNSNLMQKKPDLDDDDIPISREEEAKFMQTFRKTRIYNDYHDQDSNRDNWHSNERNSYNRDYYRTNPDGSKILHSIKGTLLEEEIFAEFDEFMAMTADEF
nr:hypothetical protein [Tanacetum cinerariifolium]